MQWPDRAGHPHLADEERLSGVFRRFVEEAATERLALFGISCRNAVDTFS
jgi:hypothetical protein